MLRSDKRWCHVSAVSLPWCGPDLVICKAVFKRKIALPHTDPWPVLANAAVIKSLSESFGGPQRALGQTTDEMQVVVPLATPIDP